MKRGWVIVTSILLAGLVTVLIIVYSWTQTPYGTLHYLAAIGVRLIYEPPDTDNYSPAELRERYRSEESSSTEYQQYIESTVDTVVTTRGQAIPLRLYYPSLEKDLPIIVYYHGGGFVFGALNEYDLLCSKLAQKSSALVVSVDYRLAPEHPYPAPTNDAYAALQWVYQQAPSIGGDSTRLAVAGDSAGGNLAAVVSLMARDSGQTFIDYQILLYPATQSINLTTESHRKFGEGYGLSTQQVAWYIDQYLPNKSDRYEVYASPLLTEDGSKLPPAFVALAGFDPLRTEGQEYAEKLREAGVPVKLSLYESTIHGFANIPQLPQSEEVLNETAAVIDSIFR